MRFTIRDLLWLTVVAALGVAWWVDRGRLAVKVVQWEERYMPGLPAPPYMMERLVNERPEAEIAEERKRVDEWLHRKDNWQPVETPDSSAPAPNPPKN